MFKNCGKSLQVMVEVLYVVEFFLILVAGIVGTLRLLDKPAYIVFVVLGVLLAWFLAWVALLPLAAFAEIAENCVQQQKTLVELKGQYADFLSLLSVGVSKARPGREAAQAAAIEAELE